MNPRGRDLDFGDDGGESLELDLKPPRIDSAPSIEIVDGVEDQEFDLPLHDGGLANALSLVGQSIRDRGRVRSPIEQVDECVARDDFSGALEKIDALLTTSVTDLERARLDQIRSQCTGRLRQMYLARLGSLDQVPSVAVKPHELHWFSMGHRAGYILSLIDGTCSLRDVVDVASMPEFEVVRVLAMLVEQKVILLRRPR